MPVGMLQNLPGVTKQQYDQVNEKMFGQSPPPPDKTPDGMIVHSAGPSENGWYVCDIWESRDAFQRFMDNQLRAAVSDVMGDIPMQPGSEPQFFEIESLAVAR